LSPEHRLQGRNTPAPLLAAIIAGLAMIGPFSIDTYLPSFPAMAEAFSATPLQLQQSMSVYLITIAVMTLFHGTLSDSLGRRPVILVCLLVYTVGSIGCAAAQTFGGVLIFRAIQGLAGGAGWVIGRAIVRDRFEGHQAQRVLSLATMIFSVAPAVAPVIGGWLQGAFGWRSVFVFLALYGGAMLAVCWFRLPETHPPAARQPFEFRPLARNYLDIAGNRLMILLCLTAGFNFAGFFLYVAGAPAFIYDLLELGEEHFSVLFVPMVAGIMLGAFLSGRLAGRLAPRRTIVAGFALLFAAAAWNVAYHFWLAPSLPGSVLPVMCYAIGMALSGPSLQLLVLDLFPRNRGLASSLQGFTHHLGTACTAGLVVPFLAGSAFTLALGQLVLLSAGACCWLLYRRLAGKSTNE
jgi:MFS transporter, DHA1 family, multidrug resistance protein